MIFFENYSKYFENENDMIAEFKKIDQTYQANFYVDQYDVSVVPLRRKTLWKSKAFIQWKDLIEKFEEEKNMCIFCLNEIHEKKGHSSQCWLTHKSPYVFGFILKDSVKFTNNENLYVRNHLLVIDCGICYNSINGDKILFDISCGHTMCIECMIKMRDSMLGLCPFCKKPIADFTPLMQLPENFLEVQKIVHVQKFSNENNINIFVDTVTGEIELVNENHCEISNENLLKLDDREKNKDFCQVKKTIDKFQKQQIFAQVCEILWLTKF